MCRLICLDILAGYLVTSLMAMGHPIAGEGGGMIEGGGKGAIRGGIEKTILFTNKEVTLLLGTFLVGDVTPTQGHGGGEGEKLEDDDGETKDTQKRGMIMPPGA